MALRIIVSGAAWRCEEVLALTALESPGSRRLAAQRRAGCTGLKPDGQFGKLVARHPGAGGSGNVIAAEGVADRWSFVPIGSKVRLPVGIDQGLRGRLRILASRLEGRFIGSITQDGNLLSAGPPLVSDGQSIGATTAPSFLFSGHPPATRA